MPSTLTSRDRENGQLFIYGSLVVCQLSLYIQDD